MFLFFIQKESENSWSHPSQSAITKDSSIMSAVSRNDVKLPPNNNHTLSISLALNKFRNFMKANFIRTLDFPTYDYAIGLTR